MKFKLLAAAALAVAAHELRLRLCSLTPSSVLSARNSHCVVLANIAEGQHLASQGITLEADVAITERNLLMKRGGAANRVAICGAADTPLGLRWARQLGKSAVIVAWAITFSRGPAPHHRSQQRPAKRR